MRRIPFSKDREEFIDNTERIFRDKIKRLQSQLYFFSRDYFIDNLDVDGNQFKTSVSNLNTIRKLDDFIGRKINPLIANLAQWFVSRIQKIFRLNREYFTQFGSTSSKNESLVYKQLGISSRNGSFTLDRGGYLSNLLRIDSAISTIKAIARTAVNSPTIKIANFRKTLRDVIQGKGLIESDIRSQSRDIFTKVDRSIGFRNSTSLKIRAAIYQGGIISTSRKFCKERNNKVFTFDEIRSFADLDWPEKPDIYDPFTDLGGYNCRHVLDYIPDALAIRLRPELRDIWKLDAA